MTNRRNILKGAAAVGGLATFGVGYEDTLKKLAKGHWSGEKPRKELTGNAPDPEFRIDPVTGDLDMNPDQALSYTMCIGCTTMCGVRVKVDKATNTVLRVTGNPYSPMSTDPFIPYDTSVRDSFRAMAQTGKGQGLTNRSTACGRGNAVLSQVTNPRRVLQPLKRVGPRGSGEWQTISFEQLIEEVVEGGNLFGEGAVAGLRGRRLGASRWGLTDSVRVGGREAASTGAAAAGCGGMANEACSVQCVWRQPRVGLWWCGGGGGVVLCPLSARAKGLAVAPHCTRW